MLKALPSACLSADIFAEGLSHSAATQGKLGANYTAAKGLLHGKGR